MASEDSDQLPSGLLAIHCLHDFGDVRESVVCAMRATSNHANALRELLEVTLLRRTHRMPLEERNDRVDQIRSTSNGVSKQVLPMVVVPAIRKHGSHAEEPHELVETLGASFALRNHKLVGDLIAGFVASAHRPVRLPNEADGEASLSVYKTNNPAELNQPFLLVFCTRHVVTVPSDWDGTRSAGYSGFPAYSQMRTA